MAGGTLSKLHPLLPVAENHQSGLGGIEIPTALRGFAASTRDAVVALRQMFGGSDFYYYQAIDECHLTPKQFARLRTDGILVKASRHWPVRWRLAQRYLSQTP